MKTLIIGASENIERYSNKAIRLLRQYKHEVVAIGNSVGKVEDIEFNSEKKEFKDIHTVSIYLSPKNQELYYDYIISLKPKRVIFNPGTENPVFQSKLSAKNIEVMEACTLVLLRTNQY